MQNKYKLFLKLSIFIFIQSFIFNISFSDQINKFNIIGNERVSDETVIMFSNLEIGDNVNADLLNNTLKELYKTNYFKNVEISFTENTINIKIEENPIIQKIVIKGVDESNLYEIVTEVTSKIEKYPFVENKVNEQIKLLKNILKSYGYYFVKLETSLVTNKNNTVDLIYDLT